MEPVCASTVPWLSNTTRTSDRPSPTLLRNVPRFSNVPEPPEFHHMMASPWQSKSAPGMLTKRPSGSIRGCPLVHVVVPVDSSRRLRTIVVKLMSIPPSANIVPLPPSSPPLQVKRPSTVRSPEPISDPELTNSVSIVDVLSIVIVAPVMRSVPSQSRLLTV